LINVMRAEFYVLARRRIWFVFMCIAAGLGFALSIVLIAIEQMTWGGAEAFSFVLMYRWLPETLCAVFAVLYVGGDLENRTMDHCVASGHGRAAVLYGKLAAYLLASAPLLLLFYAAGTLTNTVLFGWGEQFTDEEAAFVVVALGYGLLLHFGTCSIFFLVCLCFEGRLRMAMVAVWGYFLYLIVANLLVNSTIAPESLVYLLRRTPSILAHSLVSADAIENRVSIYVISSCAYIGLWSSIAYLMYRKRELK